VNYKRLEKGTYVRFQPEMKAFHDEVGGDPDVLREVLEECLMTNCTLTEGDWIQVGNSGKWGRYWTAVVLARLVAAGWLSSLQSQVSSFNCRTLQLSFHMY
jgi:hypothetical protein